MPPLKTHISRTHSFVGKAGRDFLSYFLNQVIPAEKGGARFNRNYLFPLEHFKPNKPGGGGGAESTHSHVALSAVLNGKRQEAELCDF